MLQPLHWSYKIWLCKHDLLVIMKQSILFSGIQRLPASQAIILVFTAPIMASTVARVTLHEKLKIAELVVICRIDRSPHWSFIFLYCLNLYGVCIVCCSNLIVLFEVDKKIIYTFSFLGFLGSQIVENLDVFSTPMKQRELWMYIVLAPSHYWKLVSTFGPSLFVFLV